MQFQQAYFSHTMKKWNRSLKPPLITIGELQILNSYKEMFMKKKTPSFLSSSSSSSSSSLSSLSSILSSSSLFISSPWCQPCLRSFGMKKTHYNHHRHHCHHHNYHHHHHHHHHNHHCHSFSAPLRWWFCLRSFRSKISHFPSSSLVTFQHKFDFQPRRLSSFLKKKQEIMFVFSKPCSVVGANALIFELSKIRYITFIEF